MKNSIKLLLLSLFTPLFIGVSFSYSVDLNTFDFVGNYGKAYINGSNINNTFNPNVVLASDKLYCINVKSFICEYPIERGGGSCSYNVDLMLDNPNSVISYLFTNSLGISRDNSLSVQNNVGSIWCFMSDSSSFVPVDRLPDYVSFDFDLYSKNVFTIKSSDCSQDSNYLQCLDRVNTLNGQVGTLSGSLQSCQSDLSSCTNSCDTLVSQCLDEKDTLQTTLSGCVEDKNSLQNYNDSLSQQLNECLVSGTGGTGGNYIALYDLFRSSDGSDYSLPITNNIHLPYGYRGFLDEGVLAIKQINSLNTAYSITDDDFEHKIIGSFSTIFLFLISSGLFLVFLFAIRRYFIGLKSFK